MGKPGLGNKAPFCHDKDFSIKSMLDVTECLQVEDGEHMLSTIHDISTNNIGSLCYHNTYK